MQSPTRRFSQTLIAKKKASIKLLWLSNCNDMARTQTTCIPNGLTHLPKLSHTTHAQRRATLDVTPSRLPAHLQTQNRVLTQHFWRSCSMISPVPALEPMHQDSTKIQVRHPCQSVSSRRLEHVQPFSCTLNHLIMAKKFDLFILH